jgi:putative ABC transport system ATP-binding protein
MEPSLFRYIWRHTASQQLWIVAIIFVSLPFYFLSLDLPKRIVNGPIQGRGFPEPAATQRFFEISLPIPLTGQSVPLFPGVDLERMPMLLGLSLLFLGLVCINGLFKFYINTYKGRLGERMLRRLRYELVDRVLRFPVPHFRKVKSAEVATMVKDEVEPLGGFIGDAVVLPVFLLGQAITAMTFILLQNVWLGLIAASIVGVQTFLIPKLRKRLLVLGKQQQLTARDLAGRVGEVVDGIAEVRVNDASNYERADISSRLGRIFLIRYELFQRKFFVKFLNNFLAQVTPFLFYLIGGYYAIRGELDVGQLVAVIAAYKDLPPPIKELIDWDQQRQDVQIKYAAVVEQFSPERMLPAELQAPTQAVAQRLTGAIEARGLTVTDDTGAAQLERVDLVIEPGQCVALVGDLNSGSETFCEVIARVALPTAGRVAIAGSPISELSEATTGRRIAYAGPDPYLKNGTLEDALLYGVRHHPAAAATAATDLNSRSRLETAASGNSALEIGADWLDYAGLGASGKQAVVAEVIELLRMVEMEEEILELGFRSQPKAAGHSELAGRIIEARQALHQRIKSGSLQGRVELFDPERFSQQATVAENLLFGAALDPTLAAAGLARHPDVAGVLAEAGLDRALTAMGQRIAATVSELFSGLPPDHPFFDRLSLMQPAELPEYTQLLRRISDRPFEAIPPDDRARLMTLAFGYIEPRHRLGLVSDALQGQIVDARRRLRAGLGQSSGNRLAPYDPAAYNDGLTLEDNILFGRIAYGIAEAAQQVRLELRGVIDGLGLRGIVISTGLEFEVGPAGKRLTAAQRQRVGLARALLKRPDILIVNRATSTLGQRMQAAIVERVLARARPGGVNAGMTVIWALAAADQAEPFDRTVVFSEGRVKSDSGRRRSPQPGPA